MRGRLAKCAEFEWILRRSLHREILEHSAAGNRPNRWDFWLRRTTWSYGGRRNTLEEGGLVCGGDPSLMVRYRRSYRIGKCVCMYKSNQILWVRTTHNFGWCNAVIVIQYRIYGAKCRSSARKQQRTSHKKVEQIRIICLFACFFVYLFVWSADYDGIATGALLLLNDIRCPLNWTTSAVSKRLYSTAYRLYNSMS